MKMLTKIMKKLTTFFNSQTIFEITTKQTM